MAKSPVSAAAIFDQAGYFYQALNVLQVVAPHPRENLHGAVTLVAPIVVLGAFTTELFLKCLICMEIGQASHGHDLKELFDELSAETRARLEEMWNAEIVPLRSKEWDRMEEFGLKMPRDLPADLSKKLAQRTTPEVHA